MVFLSLFFPKIHPPASLQYFYPAHVVCLLVAGRGNLWKTLKIIQRAKDDTNINKNIIYFHAQPTSGTINRFARRITNGTQKGNVFHPSFLSKGKDPAPATYYCCSSCCSPTHPLRYLDRSLTKIKTLLITPALALRQMLRILHVW